MHHNIASSRKDFHLKTAHQLCDQAQTIFAEDERVLGGIIPPKISHLNTVGLNRGMLRSECVDAAFGQFLSLAEWVCWKRGVFFMRVNPNGTSQTCPKCLVTVQKELKVRIHSCPECGYEAHRDHAAAEMVLIRGLEHIVPVDKRGMETRCAQVHCFSKSQDGAQRLWESVCRGRESRQEASIQESQIVRFGSPKKAGTPAFLGRCHLIYEIGGNNKIQETALAECRGARSP